MPAQDNANPTSNHQIDSPIIDPSIIRRERPSRIVHVYHGGMDINGSSFMWSSPCDTMIMDHSTVNFTNTSKTIVFQCQNGKATDLLEQFCQTLFLSAPVHNLTYTAMGTVLQALFRAYNANNGKFDRQSIGFGIRTMQACDRKRQSLRLQKLHRDSIPVESWGNCAIAHVNNALVDSHGVAHWSLQGTGDRDWAFNLMIDVNSKEYRTDFVLSQIPVADVLCGACELFYQAVHFFDDVVNKTDHAYLARNAIRSRLLRPANIQQASQTEATKSSEKPSSSEDNSNDRLSLSDIDKPEQEATKSNEEAPSPNDDNDVDFSDVDELEQEMSSETLESVVMHDEQSQASAPSIAQTETDETLDYETEQMAYALTTTSTFAYLTKLPWTVPEAMMQPVHLSDLGQPVLRFDEPSLLMKCRLPICLNMGGSFNPKAAICPRCGVFSYTRYCSIDHMYADIRRHFCGSVDSRSGPECGAMAVPIAIDEHTIGLPISPVRPYIEEARSADGQNFTQGIVERHRQAVYRSMDARNDYFIFDDIDRIPVSPKELASSHIGFQKLHLNCVRGKGKVYALITFSFVDIRKQKFDVLINECLRLGLAAGTLAAEACEQIYEWITQELEEQNQWDARMCERLCLQMGFEFGYRVPPEKRLGYDVEEVQDAGNKHNEWTTDLEERLKYIAGGREYP